MVKNINYKTDQSAGFYDEFEFRVLKFHENMYNSIIIIWKWNVHRRIGNFDEK